MTKPSLSSLFATMACAFLILLSGCATPKKISYFQDINKDTVIPIAREAIKLRSGDRVSIVVKSKDPQLSSLFNLQIFTDQTRGGSGVTSEGLSVYTVTPAGNIDFPVIGEIKVSGMTRSELAGFIKGELMGRGLVKDPVVTVEPVNRTVSVLGEVNKPGRIEITQDELNILQAIAGAGDLGIQGKRENVMLLRQEPDGLHTYQVDLTNLQQLAASPAFFVQPDDVIYVQPNDIKKRQATVNGNNILSWSFWVSVASLLTSVAVLVVRK